MFITDDQLKQAVADAMKQPVTSLAPAWDRIKVDANQEAYKDIVGILLNRGFTQAQIDAWDRGAAMQRLQGLYWAFVHGAGLHNFDDRWVNKYDQRANLESVAVSSGGDVSGADAGVAVSGLMNTDDDRYTIDTKW